MIGRYALLTAGLIGSLMLAAPASAVPAGPAGLQSDQTGVTQVRMMRGDRMMMRDRMMKRRMMKRRMMKRSMMKRRMMRRM